MTISNFSIGEQQILIFWLASNQKARERIARTKGKSNETA